VSPSGKICAPDTPASAMEGLQQLRPGDQVEEIHRVGLLQSATNLSDLLLGNELGITISQGWPSWLWMLLVTTSYQPWWSAFFNPLHQTSTYCDG
jgi:hypothetical protein